MGPPEAERVDKTAHVFGGSRRAHVGMRPYERLPDTGDGPVCHTEQDAKQKPVRHVGGFSIRSRVR